MNEARIEFNKLTPEQQKVVREERRVAKEVKRLAKERKKLAKKERPENWRQGGQNGMELMSVVPRSGLPIPVVQGRA